MTFEQIVNQDTTQTVTDEMHAAFAHQAREALDRRLERMAPAIGEALRAKAGATQPRRDQRHR